MFKVTTDNTEKFHQSYEAGKQALERNQYSLSIKYLEAAKELVSGSSRQGGEAQIWLVTAYQAANRIDDAIALCEKLITHPNLQTREQAQRILYIMKAPQLERPPEWMSEIPDLGSTDQGASRYVTAKKQTVKDPAEIELEDLEILPIDNQNNQFILFALMLTMLILGGLIWFSRI
jgi:outer membrane protein assembly factor BamD (BamD/ComL family)